MYFPDRAKPQPVGNVEIAHVKTADGLDLEGWYFPPKNPNGLTIVHFHGNGGNISHRLYKIRGYLRLGYGVLLAEYRGYGGNPGSPSEDGFYADARAYIDWVQKEKAPSKFVLYGESIGSGPATQMATEYKAAGLILETPMSSLEEIAANKYFFVPVRLLIKDHFMNIDKISKINMPLLMMHGHKDNTIPFVFAQKLFAKAAQPKSFIEFPDAGHNDLYDYGAADYVIKFLAGIDG